MKSYIHIKTHASVFCSSMTNTACALGSTSMAFFLILGVHKITHVFVTAQSNNKYIEEETTTY